MSDEMDLLTAVAELDVFLRATPLTEAISALERALEGADRDAAVQAAAASGVTAELLAAALTVRARLGRINDLVHAAGIALALPRLLDEGERITIRPSLAAGNDAGRPYDLRTDLRAAEFKFAQWKGADAMRKRQTFKDLVLLAASDAPRAELLVIGSEPVDFLRSCTSTASWGLDRTKGVRTLFESRFGSLDITIARFTATHAAHVTLTDVSTLLPPRIADLLKGGAG